MTTPPPLTAGELVAILACLLTRPGINPHLIARIRALLDAAPDPKGNTSTATGRW